MLVEIGEQNSFLVVRSTEDFVIVQIELVTNTKPDKIAVIDSWLSVKLGVQVRLPVAALLAREALQVVDVGPGPHHHLEGGDHFVARGAVAGGAKQPWCMTLEQEKTAV